MQFDGALVPLHIYFRMKVREFVAK